MEESSPYPKESRGGWNTRRMISKHTHTLSRLNLANHWRGMGLRQWQDKVGSLLPTFHFWLGKRSLQRSPNAFKFVIQDTHEMWEVAIPLYLASASAPYPARHDRFSTCAKRIKKGLEISDFWGESGQNQNWTSLLEVVEIISASILPVKIDQHITEVFLSLAPMASHNSQNLKYRIATILVFH
eukprot:sb/3471467/